MRAWILANRRHLLGSLAVISVYAGVCLNPLKMAPPGFEPVALALIAAGLLSRRFWFIFSITCGLLLFRIFALAEQSCQHYLHRPLELANDIRLLKSLAALLQDTGGNRAASLLALALAALGGVFFVGSWFVVHGRRAATVAVIVLSLCTGAWSFTSGSPSFSARLVEEIRILANPLELEARVNGELNQVQQRNNQINSEWRHRDVHLILIESYGALAFEHPKLAKFTDHVLPSFAAKLERSNLALSSRYYRSPTFGGRSWLAHASIDSGMQISGALRYERLLTSKVKPLAKRFGEGGYTSITVAPGITTPWPEGSYFGFERTFYLHDLGYNGPRFGWATIPDQWLFNSMAPLLRRADAPLFVEWHLVSSHAPFATHAPLLTRSQLIAPEPYADVEPIRYPIRWPYLADAHEGYLHALRYEFEVLAEALPKLLADGGIAVIVGDHQPNGALAETGASWNVPCHVVAPAGEKPWPHFVPGAIPRPNDSAPALAELHYAIVDAETLSFPLSD